MIAQAIISALFLGYAAWQDHKTCEVSNKVWLLYFPMALALTFALGFDVRYLVPIGALSVLGLVLFYVGGLGGADVKAFVCLAVAFPLLSPFMILCGCVGFVVAMRVLRVKASVDKPFLPWLFMGFIVVVAVAAGSVL